MQCVDRSPDRAIFSRRNTLAGLAFFHGGNFHLLRASDRDTARRLAAYLKDSGLSVWWDMSLKPGEVFRDEIERRIGEARHAIVLWSETSVKSKFVLDEAGEAERQNKLVPLRIDGCKLPLGFGQHHTHDGERLARRSGARAGGCRGRRRARPIRSGSGQSRARFLR